MNIRKSVIIILIFGVLAIDGHQNPGSAQSTPQTPAATEAESPSAKVEMKFDDLMLQINKNFSNLEKYEKRYVTAGTEDRNVLDLQIYKLRIQIIDDVQQLSDIYLELKEYAPQPERLSRLEPVLSRIIPQLWSYITQIGNEIDSLRGNRAKTEANLRPDLENEIARLTEKLDLYYEKALTHIRKMEQIGMDIKEASTKLVQLLEERIDALSGRLDLALERFDDFDARRKESPDDTDIIQNLNAAKKSLDTNKESMNTVLALMEALELDTALYRTQLLTETRDLTSGAMDKDVAFKLLSRSYKNTVDWLAKNGPGYIVKIFLFIIIIFIFVFIARVVRKILDKTLNAPNLNLSTLSRRMIVSTVSKLIIIFGILVALSQWGISLGPLLAGLGIAGFIVGFALQDTLGNFASGLMILLYRPYDVDDLIDVGGIFGRVEKMSLVSTSLLTLDNQLFVVPNSKIWGDVIKNITAQDVRRIDMVFGISYSDNIPKAETILKDILESHELVLDTPEPAVHLHTLGESSVDFVVRPWVKVKDYWDVYWDITRAVKLRFDEEGVSIPFPQRDVHIYNHSSIDEGDIIK